MKISIVGDIPNESLSYIGLIDTFVDNNKVGSPVILSAGDLTTLSTIDKYAKSKGYDSIIMGNVFSLAVLNADKVIVIWNGENRKYQEVIDTCQKEKKAFMEIRTK